MGGRGASDELSSGTGWIYSRHSAAQKKPRLLGVLTTVPHRTAPPEWYDVLLYPNGGNTRS